MDGLIISFDLTVHSKCNKKRFTTAVPVSVTSIKKAAVLTQEIRVDYLQSRTYPTLAPDIFLLKRQKQL